MEEDVCRICAGEHCLQKSIKLFDKANRKTLHNIKQITGIMLKNEKNMPEYMCDDCQMRLKLALDFRETCLQSQRLLRLAKSTDKKRNKLKNQQIVPEFENCTNLNVMSDNENVTKINIKCSPSLSNNENEHDLPLRLIETVEDQKPIEMNLAENNNLPHISGGLDEKPNIFELEPEIDLNECVDEKPITFELNETNESQLETETCILNENNEECIDDTTVDLHSTIGNDDSLNITSPEPMDDYDTDTDWNVSENDVKLDKNETKRMPVKKRKYERKTKSKSKIEPTSDDNVKKRKNNKSIPACEKETKYICYLCGEKFYCLTYYTHHMNRHKGEKTFVCDQCPQRFYTQQMLKRHSYRHTGVRPYSCSFCSQTFIDKYAKLRHEQAHQNLRPYKCTECEKAFNTNDTLKRHMLTHTGIREFSCTLCQRSFLQKKHLITHYRSMFHKQNEEKANTNENVHVVANLQHQQQQLSNQ